ncbi:MAG: hypothetical protein AAF621_06475 [Pseudomonadota bacterium]
MRKESTKITSSDKRRYAEEILKNPIFIALMQQMHDHCVLSLKNLPWDDIGDAQRRKLSLKIEIIEEISRQFEIAILSDQAKVNKADKIRESQHEPK